MQNVSLDFKENIKKNAIISDGYLTFTDNDLYTETFDSSDIISFSISGNAFQKDKVIGNIAQTNLTIELLGDKTASIPRNKEIYIQAFIGIFIDDITGYEYVQYNDFLLFDISYKDTSNITKINASDELIKLNHEYVDTNTYPMSLLAYASDVVSSCGLTLENTTFINDDFVIDSKPFNDYTSAREIISKIAELSASFVVINRETGNLEFRSAFPSLLSSDESLSKSNYFDFKLTEDNFGQNGINTLVIRISQVEGENNTVENSANVAIDGAIELVIEDNDIVNSEYKRLQVINTIFSVIDGYKYQPYKIEYVGFPYLELGDIINVKKKDDSSVSTPIYEFSIKYDGGLLGKHTAKGVSKTQTSYKFSDGLEKRVRNAEIIVNKVDGEITSLTSIVDGQGIRLTNTEQTVDGLQIEVSAIGGGNVIPNIIGEYGTMNWTFESTYWQFQDTTPYVEFNSDIPILFMGSNSQIMYPVVTDTLAESGFQFFHNGKSLSYIVRAEGGANYSLYTRYKGSGQLTFKLREYTSLEPADKGSFHKETTLGITNITSIWNTFEDTIELDSSTQSILLVVESDVDILNQEYVVFTDSSVNMGLPRPYSESLTDINDKAEYAVTLSEQTADGFNLLTLSVDEIDGRVTNAESEISTLSDQIVLKVNVDGNVVTQELSASAETGSLFVVKADNIELEGIVTANSYFKINTDGSMEATDGTFSGNLSAGTIAGLIFDDSAITFPDGELKLNSDTNSIEFGSFVLKWDSFTPQVGTPVDIMTAFSQDQPNSPIQFGFANDIGSFVNVENIINTSGELNIGYPSATVNLPMGLKWDGLTLYIDSNGFVKAS